MWNRGLLKILNDIKLILDDQGNHLDSSTVGLIYNQFGIILALQRSPISQTSNWSGTFFAVSYIQQTGFKLWNIRFLPGWIPTPGFLPGWYGQKWSACGNLLCQKWPINQFKPVQQSRQQTLELTVLIIIYILCT